MIYDHLVQVISASVYIWPMFTLEVLSQAQLNMTSTRYEKWRLIYITTVVWTSLEVKCLNLQPKIYKMNTWKYAITQEYQSQTWGYIMFVSCLQFYNLGLSIRSSHSFISAGLFMNKRWGIYVALFKKDLSIK